MSMMEMPTSYLRLARWLVHVNTTEEEEQSAERGRGSLMAGGREREGDSYVRGREGGR